MYYYAYNTWVKLATYTHCQYLIDILIFLQREELCLYQYAVEQQYFDGDAKQNITVSADIEISCHSSNHSLHAAIIPVNQNVW